jgi:hypothetical protein
VVYITIEIRINRNFHVFIDLKSFELKVPTICLVTGGVSGRRDRRYTFFTVQKLNPKNIYYQSR